MVRTDPAMEASANEMGQHVRSAVMELSPEQREAIQLGFFEGLTQLGIDHKTGGTNTAAWIIDLGPEGGHRGGQIIGQGTPEDVAQNPASHTGRFLAKMLEASESKPAKTVKRKKTA